MSASKNSKGRKIAVEKTVAAKPATSISSPNSKTWIYLLTIILATIIVFGPSINNQWTNWDDESYVLKNPLVTGFDIKGIFKDEVMGNYHPVTILTLAIEYSFFKDDASGYHAVSMLLHLLNALCCYYFLIANKTVMETIKLKSSFTQSLPADPNLDNYPRQVMNACYSFVQPKVMISPKMVIYSKEVASDLNLDQEYCESQDFIAIMTGNKLAEGSKPYAMCYGGHQFGHWAGQLGDGRAINLGEVEVSESHLNLQLKGAGPTPYSRTADGFAVLRSSIREFLCSEAMFHIGVPTTRALSLTLTGEHVLRDMMYDGNAAYEKGAIVCRVAPSFIRFGNFEIFKSRNDMDNLKQLTDYTIQQYFPELVNDKKKYLQFFKTVADRTCDMIVQWQRTVFVHGVMNTDNMSILGISIDYGPYGWIDNYDPDWTPNSTDLPGKRYRFGNQPIIAQWNLLKLANALYPLINDEEALKTIVQDFRIHYSEKYLKMMKSKLGLFENDGDDESLINDLEKMLQVTEIDMTIFFRNLTAINDASDEKECLEVIKPAVYDVYLFQKSIRFIHLGQSS